MKNTSDSMKRKKIKYGSYSTVVTAVVIAIVVIINLLIAQLPAKWTQIDLSSNKIYSISGKTKDFISDLDEDITIEVLSDKKKSNKQLDKFLNGYKDASKHVKIKYSDPALNLNLANKYSSLTENSIIVKGEKKEKTINYNDIYVEDYTEYYRKGVSSIQFNGERLLTGAIAYVISDNLPVLYNVTGHGELPLGNSAANMVMDQNITLKDLNLMTTSIPDDCDALLINAPQRDYNEDEANKIIEYLNNGGKAMILASYNKEPLTNFKSVLAAYGIDIMEGVAVEGVNHYYEQPIYVVPGVEDSEITAGLDKSNILLISAVGLSENYQSDAEVTALLSSSDEAYLKVIKNDVIDTFEKEDGDIELPFAYAYLSEKTVGSDDEKKGSLIAVSAVSLLDENINMELNVVNLDFFGNSLSYLCGGNDYAAVSIPSKNMDTSYLTFKAMHQVVISVVTIILLPLLIFVSGLVIWLKRRKR